MYLHPGRRGRGGGIFNAGMLIVSNTTLSGNSAFGRLHGAGGGIFNAGTLTITDSTLNGNSASGGGGLSVAAAPAAASSTPAR